MGAIVGQQDNAHRAERWCLLLLLLILLALGIGVVFGGLSVRVRIRIRRRNAAARRLCRTRIRLCIESRSACHGGDGYVSVEGGGLCRNWNVGGNVLFGVIHLRSPGLSRSTGFRCSARETSRAMQHPGF